jgi:hypothetical protein
MREFVSVSRDGVLFILNNDSTGRGRGWGGIELMLLLDSGLHCNLFRLD